MGALLYLFKQESLGILFSYQVNLDIFRVFQFLHGVLIGRQFSSTSI